MAKVRFFLFGRAGAASPPFTHFAANYPIPSPNPFPRAANKKTAPTSNCTIPFGNPPLSKTPRISDTHHLNEKVTRKPAKRNLQPARAGRNEISATRKDRRKRITTNPQGQNETNFGGFCQFYAKHLFYFNYKLLIIFH